MSSRDEWIEIGEIAKEIKAKTQSLRIDSQGIVSKKTLDHLTDALIAINDFRNDAEHEMFVDGLSDVNVFFGTQEVERTMDLFLKDFEWTGRMSASDLYEYYSIWSKRKGFKLLSLTAFGTEMSKKRKKIKSNGNYYLAQEDAKG